MKNYKLFTALMMAFTLCSLGLPAQDTRLEWKVETGGLYAFQPMKTEAEMEASAALGLWTKVKNGPDEGWLLQIAGEGEGRSGLTLDRDFQGSAEVLRAWEAGKKNGLWKAQTGLLLEVRKDSLLPFSGGLEVQFEKAHLWGPWEARWEPEFRFFFRPGGEPHWLGGLGASLEGELGAFTLGLQGQGRVDTESGPRIRVEAAAVGGWKLDLLRINADLFRGNYRLLVPEWNGALAWGQKVSYGSRLTLGLKLPWGRVEAGAGKIWWALDGAAVNAEKDRLWNFTLLLRTEGSIEENS